jgi:hypothetical protein
MFNETGTVTFLLYVRFRAPTEFELSLQRRDLSAGDIGRPAR